MSTLKVVDPHFHLWDLSTGYCPHFEKPSDSFIGNNAPIARSYLLEEFLAEGAGAVELVGAVHVEAIPTDPVGETRYVQAVADGRRSRSALSPMAPCRPPMSAGCWRRTSQRARTCAASARS